MSKTEKIAFLPLGAHEQHGPHLPFETDAIIAQGLSHHIEKALPAHLDVTFLPVESVGYSPEHLWQSGTKSLSYHEAIERWIQIGKDCQSGGIAKILFLNAHGGNSPLLTIVTTELRVHAKMLAVATSWGRFGLPDGLISPDDKALDIHGGFIETSMMLALAPQKVDMKKAENFYNHQQNFAKDFHHLRAYGSHAFGWQMNDLNERGAVGNATRASQEAGLAMLDHATKGVIELIDDMAKFDLTLFDHKNEG